MKLTLPILNQSIEYDGGEMELRGYLAIVKSLHSLAVNAMAAKIDRLVSKNKHLTEENQRLRAAAILDKPAPVAPTLEEWDLNGYGELPYEPPNDCACSRCRVS